MERREGELAARALAGLLALMGLLHFVAPGPFDRLVPRALPGSARAWTHASGIAELACAAAVASPRHRRRGGLLTAILFVAVFPANVQMALDSGDGGTGEKLVAWGRLPLQVPLVWWALRVRAGASAD